MKIFKYELLPDLDVQTIKMPFGSVVLCAQVQRKGLFLWVETMSKVSEFSKKPFLMDRKFRVRGTGHEYDKGISENYIGTVQMNDGDLVWHIFEVIS